MHAYLVVGKDRREVDKEVGIVVKTINSTKLEFPFSKIEDVRELGKFISLKLGTSTCIILKNVDKTTDEALNAFLKILEEPQENLYFILTADNLYNLLPTIISRCQVIAANSLRSTVYSKDITEFFSKSLSEKFNAVGKIKKREDAINFLEELFMFTHENLTKSSSYVKSIRNLKIENSTINNLEANGNVSLQLINLIVNLV